MTDREILEAAAQMLRWWADRAEAKIRTSKHDLDNYFFIAFPEATSIDAIHVANKMLEAVRNDYRDFPSRAVH